MFATILGCMIFNTVALSSPENKQDQITLSDKLQEINSTNIFRDPEYFNWCNSIIKGDDGKYHLIYSRWKRNQSFQAWLTKSTIAHAISDSPTGPYRYVNTLVDFEKPIYKAGNLITAHNPKIKKFNGKYYLYFIGTHADKDLSSQQLDQIAKNSYSDPMWTPLRENQRSYVAVSDSISGPWKIEKKPLVKPDGPIQTLAVNPAITQGKDGKFYLIIKGDKKGADFRLRSQAIALSDFPDKGFKIQEKPVIDGWDTEDVSMWCDEKTGRFYAIFHAHNYLGLMTSADGIHWEKAKDFKITTKNIKRQNGQPDMKVSRMERPSVFLEKGKPVALSVAVMDKGDITGDTFIVIIPLKH